MKKKSIKPLIISLLTLSALCLTACNGCGSKKDAQTSEIPLIVLEDKNSTQVAEKTEVETSEDGTSTGKEAKKDENKKVPVVIEDKNTQKTTTTTKPKAQETPQTQTTTQAQTPQPADSTWQTPAGQNPGPAPQTPSVSTDKPAPKPDDDGTIVLPMIPLD